MITPINKRSSLGLFTKAALAFACAYGVSLAAANAQITTVVYILLENRCFTSGTDTSYSNVLFQNKNGGSPWITALCTPGTASPYTFNYQGTTIPQNAHSAFCSAYHNDFATPTNSDSSGNYTLTSNTVSNGTVTENANNSGTQGSPILNTPVHPSEPNYVFMEAGSNLSKFDDNDPYGSGLSVQQISTFLSNNPAFSGENLSGLLQNAGISWTSYTEGTCLLNTANQDFNSKSGTLTNNPAPIGVRTVPLASFSSTSASYTNAYNGSHQYNFAAKHTGQLFFPATNGSASTGSVANTSAANSEVQHYEPLELFSSDLANNSVAAYAVITPDQYNDGHTALTSAFTYHNYGGTASGVNQNFTGGSDLERIGQMDNFCAIVVPQIMASPVYQAGHCAIVIWTDETEGGPQNDFFHTLTEFVISPYTKGNAYNSALNYTHSSDVATMQEIFGVVGNTPSGYLNDAANQSNATSGVSPITNSGQGLQNSTSAPFYGLGTGTAQDLSDLFQSGTIPSGLPTVQITPSGYIANARAHTVTQTVTLTNPLTTTTAGPVYLVLGNLSANTSLQSTTPSSTIGTSTTTYPGSPYVNVAPSGLAAGASVTVTLHFAYPSSGIITDALATVSNGATP